jgi:hypothetical protein
MGNYDGRRLYKIGHLHPFFYDSLKVIQDHIPRGLRRIFDLQSSFSILNGEFFFRSELRGGAMGVFPLTDLAEKTLASVIFFLSLFVIRLAIVALGSINFSRKYHDIPYQAHHLKDAHSVV